MNNLPGPQEVLEIEPLSPAVGAVIRGVELASADEATVAAIRRVLLDHLVVFFEDQALNPEELMRLGQGFGDLFVHPNLRAVGKYPEVIAIRRESGDKSIVGAEWHTDTTCMEMPPMGAILHAEQVPPTGGDTLFANQYLAYEALSEGMQTMLGQLRAVHNDTRVAGPQVQLNAKRSTATREDDHWVKTETTHPVVRVHPETGRRGLFVNIAYTRRFEGMTEAESAPLLDYLFAHAVRPEFTCRFAWKPGSVAFWDNRCVKHLAVNDIVGHARVMKRVQITGDKPV
jgi:taurine dioxygenase